jgi:hypothetical protein
MSLRAIHSRQIGYRSMAKKADRSTAHSSTLAVTSQGVGQSKCHIFQLADRVCGRYELRLNNVSVRKKVGIQVGSDASREAKVQNST